MTVHKTKKSGFLLIDVAVTMLVVGVCMVVTLALQANLSGLHDAIVRNEQKNQYARG